MLTLGQVSLPLPPAGTITDRQTLAALKAHGDLVERARLELDKLDKAIRHVETAREQDRVALAGALRAGQQDPGTDGVAAAEQAVEDARRTADALLLAAQDARDDTVAVIAKRRETLATDTAAKAAETRERLHAVIGEVRDAAAAYGDARAASSWADRFPEAGAGAGAPRLLGLIAANGEPRRLAEVLVALGDFADQ